MGASLISVHRQVGASCPIRRSPRVENAIAVNPAHSGIKGVLHALTKGTRLVLVRHDSWHKDDLVELAKGARDHPSAGVVMGHGRLREDCTLAGLLARPRLIGPVAIRADRWPEMELDEAQLMRDPVFDHAASWILAILCAGYGGEVACCDRYHPRRLRPDPHDADELRPEGRAWLAQLATRLVPDECLGAPEARLLWKSWSGGR